MFYTFRQNNSGGHFVVEPTEGISQFVIVEAANEVEAIRKAEDIGLYWNGVDNGSDCECCGDRWDASPDKYPEPMIYGKPAAEYYGLFTWTKEHHVYVHYADGTIQGLFKGNERKGDRL